MKQRKRALGIFLLVAILVTIIIVSLILYKIPQGAIESNKIAVIPINGLITSGDMVSPGSGFLYENTITSGGIINFIEAANKDKNIKGVILNINSPGGTVVGSKEIVDAIKKVDKPVVALIRDVGASGAYWVASATDLIIADPLSVTGSIGVFGGYLEFSDLMSKYGVEFHSIKSGKYKDLGNQFVNLTEEGERILQGKLGIIHDYFLEDVNKNRKRDDFFLMYINSSA